MYQLLYKTKRGAGQIKSVKYNDAADEVKKLYTRKIESKVKNTSTGEIIGRSFVSGKKWNWYCAI